MPKVEILTGDCREQMKSLGTASIDAIVTDPPYELAFMGKGWDNAGIAFDKLMWAECLRALKPGGHLLSFGGTRTYHRMAVAIEDAGFEIRDSIHWIYGSGFPKSLDVSKAIDKAARGVPQGGPDPGSANHGKFRTTKTEGKRWEGDSGQSYGAGGSRFLADGTASGWATDHAAAGAAAIAPDAARWSGWGTSLKPAHEPVILARKPGDIEAITQELNRLWRAQAADPTTRTGAVDGSSDPTGTSPFGSATTTCSNTVSSWRECWAETCDLMSTSTTATTSSTTTDLRTLRSCLAQITPANITTDPTRPSGLTSIASAADHLFAAVLLSLRATHALSVAGIATADMLTSPPAGRGSHEPIVVARKPLIGTVAANVLAHGTGGLNIGGCRVETDWATDPTRRGWQGRKLSHDEGTVSFVDHNKELSQPNVAGRWPANVIFDEDAGAELDDTGGASRFFYCAKANGKERPDVNGVKHPTVKPLSLMRYLVKLVTPPQGIVLDPFTGSGTTIEAALLEGFDVIGCELTPEYLPMIRQRIERVTGEITCVGLDDLAEFDWEPDPMTTNAGRSLLERSWEEVDRLVESLMTPDIDKTTTAYHQNSGRLLGMAHVLALFMNPHLTSEKEVLGEGVRRKKARDAGEFYETAGIGSRKLEGPPTSVR